MPKEPVRETIVKMVVLAILVPFTVLGHWTGMMWEALARAFVEGRGFAKDLLDEVQKVSDERRKSRGR